MKANKLAKRLRREAAANPAKAAVLGLLLLVAIYFWAPLAAGWWSEEEPAAGRLDAVTPAAPLAPAAATASAAAAQPTTPSTWQELVTWIEDDPRMRPVELAPESRDPFRPLQAAALVLPQEEGDEEAEEMAAAAPPEITPESVGLALVSTAISPGRRTALLKGEGLSEGTGTAKFKAYDQAQAIVLTDHGETVSFTLLDVQPRQVVLAREGKEYVLSMPVRQPAGIVAGAAGE